MKKTIILFPLTKENILFHSQRYQFLVSLESGLEQPCICKVALGFKEPHAITAM